MSDPASEGPAQADVVPLFPLGELDSPVRTSERGRFCTHDAVTLDTDARRIYCRGCGREVPAFDYLERLARKWERYAESLKEIKRRTTVARSNLEELLRDERNAKTRKRRRAMG